MLKYTRTFSLQCFLTFSKQKYLQNVSLVSNGLLYQDNQNSFQRRNFSKETPIIKNLIEYQQNIFDTISYSTPVHYAQDFLIGVHNLSGLDWGSSIVLSAFLLRFTLTLPLTIYQQYVLAKFENVVTDKFPKLLEELKRETAITTKMRGWDNDKANFYFARSANKHYKNMIVEENCHPAKASLLMLVQIPLWVSASFAVRNLISIRPEKTIDALQIYADLSTERFLWISNLLEADSTFVLPFTLALCNLAIVEIQVLYRSDEAMSKYKKYSTNVFRLIAIFLIPVAAVIPSVLSLYWASSAFYGLVQNLLVLSPKFKKTFHIPFTKKTKYLPYQHMWNTLIDKIKTL